MHWSKYPGLFEGNGGLPEFRPSTRGSPHFSHVLFKKQVLDLVVLGVGGLHDVTNPVRSLGNPEGCQREQ